MSGAGSTILWRRVGDPFLPPGSERRASAVIAETDSSSGASGDIPQQREGTRQRAGKGGLAVIGAGVMAVNHLTIEAQHLLERADRVFCAGVDPVTERWAQQRNSNVQTIEQPDSVDEVERGVRAGLQVCVLLGECEDGLRSQVYASVERCRTDGCEARALASISLEDCLASDLTPGTASPACQIYDIERLRTRTVPLDPAAALVLRVRSGTLDRRVAEMLLETYGAAHMAVLYDPARYVILSPVVRHHRIEELLDADLTGVTVVYVPPRET